MKKYAKIGIVLLVGVLGFSISFAFLSSSWIVEERGTDSPKNEVQDLTAMDAYEKGYLEGIVSVNSKSENAQVKIGENIQLRISFTYQGKSQAPENVRLIPNSDKVSVDVPYKPIENGKPQRGGSIRINKFLSFKPILIKKGQTVETIITFSASETFPENKLLKSGVDTIPIPIGNYRVNSELVVVAQTDLLEVEI
ncbi:hypothetical protein AKJ41_02845 [candidate division MSBL1 archaeon SCGC-AAA259O05]|uniref:Uncharacterized protein n=1 Tax=candidate division MSBL1 archaeon SCGC-AAA259O05 TaxID=1698271 RepID=A0A133V3R5_9EURY|nr:hypothetical protein AKJ41_02845 [candidate division MSBL1 archaeon SCGC-AAA259O05]